MRAVIRKKRGDPEKALRVVVMEKPKPKNNEVLVKIHAATVTRGDALMLSVPTFLFPLMRLVRSSK